MKRIIALFSAAALMLPLSVEAGAQYDDLVYEDGCAYYVDPDTGTAFLEDCRDYEGDLYVPSTVRGCTVAAVDQGAGYQNEGLTSVILPETVKTVGNSAFAFCPLLESVDVGAECEYIGEEAFMFCRKLGTVELGESLIEIDDKAFKDCLLIADIRFPETLVRIGDMAFMDDILLTDITIPDSAEKIGDRAFGYYTAYMTQSDSLTDTYKESIIIRASEGSAGADYALENGFSLMEPGAGRAVTRNDEKKKSSLPPQARTILVTVAFTLIMLLVIALCRRLYKDRWSGRVRYDARGNPLPKPEGEPGGPPERR